MQSRRKFSGVSFEAGVRQNEPDLVIKPCVNLPDLCQTQKIGYIIVTRSTLRLNLPGHLYPYPEVLRKLKPLNFKT